MKASYGVSRDPLTTPAPGDMLPLKVGTPICATKPNEPGTIVCQVNGVMLSRMTTEQRERLEALIELKQFERAETLRMLFLQRADQWSQPVLPGDVIVWYVIPEGREGFRVLLQIVAVVVSIYAPGSGYALLALAANVAYNLLVPPALAKVPQQAQPTDDNFATALQGNVARIDQPIWKSFGHVEITPPFACEPYYEYLPKIGAADPDLDRDQYYYAVFAVGIGNQDVVAKLANTALSSFQDIVVARYLPPGELPTSVNPNVTNAPELSTPQILDTARYVGGFVACPARQTVTHVGVDVSAINGLGETHPLTVNWRVEWRPINDFGQALGAWATLATETRTAFTSTPQNWSNKYAIPGNVRPAIRLVRTDLENTQPLSLHKISWVGLRAYRGTPAPLNPNAAHYELVMRASSQLSNQTSRDFRLICDCYARTWSEDDGWGAEVITRNAAWAMLSLCTESWGLEQPDERIDLVSFARLAAVWDARQDHFDYTFDTTTNAWDALQLIARTGRARVFKRNGVISIARDQLADLPVTAFSPRNCMPDSMKISEALRKRTTPNGVIVQYRDHRTREWTDIECPCPGVELADMNNPVYKRLDGVIGATHAEREGLYEAANILYRSQTVEWETEAQGMIPAYMSPVRWQPQIVAYGQSGDVAFWDDDTLAMGLTEPVDFASGPQYLALIRDDATLTTPVLVLPGAGPNDIVLPAAPDFDLVLDDGTRERPKYLLGPLGSDELVKVSAIADGGESEDGLQLFKLQGVIDDDRVHLADVSLLPGPGDIQDPIGLPDGDAGGGFFAQPRLLDYTFGPQSTDEDLFHVLYGFAIDGTVATDPVSSGDLSNQWLIGSPTDDPSFAAQFEVFAEVLTQEATGEVAKVSFNGLTGTWTSLATEQDWSVDVDPTATPGTRGVWSLRLYIRDAATLTVQTANTILIQAQRASFSDGGD